MINEEKQKALEAALGHIEKQYGKGSVMKLGESGANMQVETVPTGSLSLDIALGVGGVPKGRIIEIYGPESKREAELPDLLMLSMLWTRYMPRILVWILTIYTYHSRITENRHWRSQRLWYDQVQWIL